MPAPGLEGQAGFGSGSLDLTPAVLRKVVDVLRQRELLRLPDELEILEDVNVQTFETESQVELPMTPAFFQNDYPVSFAAGLVQVSLEGGEE